MWCHASAIRVAACVNCYSRGAAIFAIVFLNISLWKKKCSVELALCSNDWQLVHVDCCVARLRELWVNVDGDELHNNVRALYTNHESEEEVLLMGISFCTEKEVKRYDCKKCSTSREKKMHRLERVLQKHGTTSRESSPTLMDKTDKKQKHTCDCHRKASATWKTGGHRYEYGRLQ